MTDWSRALARAFEHHLELGGSSGSRGSHRGFDNSSKGMRQETARTSSCDAMVLVVPSSTESCKEPRPPLQGEEWFSAMSPQNRSAYNPFLPLAPLAPLEPPNAIIPPQGRAIGSKIEPRSPTMVPTRYAAQSRSEPHL